MKKTFFVLSATFITLLIVGACNRQDTKTAQVSTPSPPIVTQGTAQSVDAAPQIEEYHSIDPAAAGFTIEMNVRQIEWTADGRMSGSIAQLSCSDQDGHSFIFALVSNDVGNGEIQTKTFGVIKVHSAGGFSNEYLMKDSQVKHVKAALQTSLMKGIVR